MSSQTSSASPSWYERHAASAAESYERHFVPAIGEPIARRLLRAARPMPGEHVLDVACGTGIVARLASDAVGTSGAVEGLDANPAMLAVARRETPGIHWHEASADDVPLADGAVDLALCSMGLQFFPDPERALREMHRLLVPGGRAVWCTPGPTPPLMAAIDQALRHHLGSGASMFVHAVFSLHDPDQARALMERAGFGGIEVETTSVPLRLPPPVEFFWQYVLSTPLAAAAAELDERQREALEAEVAERCSPFGEGGDSVMEPGLVIARGHRESGDERTG